MLHLFNKGTKVERFLNLGVFVERENILEGESVELGFWEARKSKSDIKLLCCELIYANLARAKEFSLERLDTTRNLARPQEASLECRIHSFRYFTVSYPRSSVKSLTWAKNFTFLENSASGKNTENSQSSLKHKKPHLSEEANFARLARA